MQTTLGAGDHPITDNDTIAHTNLAGENDPVPDLGSAGDPNLSREGAAAANGHAVADLHQVVDLGAGPNPGFTDGRTVNGAAAAQLNLILQHNPTGLWHLPPTLGGRDKTEPFRADNSIGIDHATTTQTGARIKDGIGMQLTAIPHNDPVVNHDSGMQHTVRADATACTDAHPGADRRACTDHSPLIDHRCWMDLGRGTVAGHQLVQGFRKRQARVGENGEGNAAFTGPINQVLLIGEQKSTRTGLSQLNLKSISFLKKAELIRGGQFKGGGALQQRISTGIAPEQSRIPCLQGLEQGAEAHGQTARRPDRKRAQR